MKLQRFEDENMRKVLARVRAEMGVDAVLVSSRHENGRAEVIATLDYQAGKLHSALAELDGRRANSNESAPALDLVWEVVDNHEQDRTTPEPAADDSFARVLAELGNLRRLFEAELAQSSSHHTGARQTLKHRLLERLEAAGLNPVTAGRLVARVLPCKDVETGWRRIQQILCRCIPIATTDILHEGGTIALVGTSGVGKTATAAKIAAQFALLHGRHEIAFITTDSNRVGGQSQLVALGTVLGIPVQVVSESKEIQGALASYAGRKLVIIDTGGVTQHDSAALAALSALFEQNPVIAPYLVLSATTRESVIAETLGAFIGIRLSGAIVTKLDESLSVGPVLSSLIEFSLPIAFIADGPTVPDDLQRARISYFVNRIINAYKTRPEADSGKNLAEMSGAETQSAGVQG